MKILVTDDSKMARKMVIKTLTEILQDSVEIHEAQNGQEALDKISQNRPDAIILDLMMPDIDGYDVLKTIRNTEATAHIPVLILTAKDLSKDDLNLLIRNNVHQLIQKGDVNRNELLKAIADLYKTGTSEELNIKTHKKSNER